mgnify:CR=1 FL=1
MPNPAELSTATGQLGPICTSTGKPITFAEAIVLDDKYVCWEAYLEITGAKPATDGKDIEGLTLDLLKT